MALHDQMMKFTVSRMFNKSKDIKLPVLPFPKQLGSGSNLSHLDYYKHMKERYIRRQVQITQEQQLVQMMLQ